MSELIQCPNCAEEIKSEAKICKHCKSPVSWTRDLLENIETEILKSDTKWTVRSKGVNSISLLYTVKDKKASCASSCCLGCIFLPIGIFYAILGGKSGYDRQMVVSEVEWGVELSGHPYYILKTYKLLKKKGYGDDVIFNEELTRAKKWWMLLRK